LFLDAYAPTLLFPAMAKFLVELESVYSSRLSAESIHWIRKKYDGRYATEADTRSDVYRGVMCSDQGGRFYQKTLQDLAPQFQRLKRQSFLMGGLGASTPICCTDWSMVSNDTYQGTFISDHMPSSANDNQVLLVGKRATLSSSSAILLTRFAL
jgi:hypothetical protein